MPAISTAPLGNSLNDLSIQAFNGIFGTNWFSMEPEITGSATTIVKMLMMLNEVAMFAVAGLFSAVYMVAVVGTAHEGTPLGKKLHSFWVPVRFSLATGMLVPLKSGLCLFQLILLTTVGWSIHFANELWGVFLESSVQSQIISRVKQDQPPTPIYVESEKVAKDILANLVVYKYHESQYNLGGGNMAFRVDDNKHNLLHYTYQFRDPGSLIDDNRAFGSVELFCHNLRICQEQSNAVVSLIKDLEPVAQDLVARGTAKSDTMPSSQAFIHALNRFANRQQDIVKAVYMDELNRLEQESGAFLEGAKEMGWIGAGSFYHTVLGLQSKALELVKINVTSSPPNVNAKHDGFRQYENTMRVAAAYTHNAAIDIKRFVAAAKAGGSTSLFETVFGETFNLTILNVVAHWMTEGDPIHAMSRFGNYIIATVDGSIALYTTLRAFIVGAKDAKEASWFGSAFDGLVTQGAASGVLGGLHETLSSLAVLFWMLVIALWGVAHVLAFYLPAVPFIFWVSGVIGWMILVVEAMVAAPLWIVAHAMPEGEGLTGDRGQQGYMLLLAILVRPFLMLLGLCIALILMDIVGKLVGNLFMVYIASFEAHADFVMPIHSTVAFLIMLGAMMIIFVHKLFGMISYLPDNVLRWVGGHSPSLHEEADEHKTNMMMGGLVNRTETAMRGGAGAAGTKPKHSSDGENQQEGSTGDGSASGAVSKTTQQLAPGEKSGGEREEI